MKLYHIIPAAAAVAGVAALIRAAAEWRALHLLGVRRIVELQRELAEARRSVVAWQGLAAEALKKATALANEAEEEREQPREEMAVTHDYADGPDMPQTVFDPPSRPTGAEGAFAHGDGT